MPDTPPTTALRTGIVIPCYNEQDHLQADAFVEFAARHPNVRFEFVNDGSTDETQAKIEEIAGAVGESASVMALPDNRGKAEAVRQGMHELLADPALQWVGYWDADHATPLEEIARFMSLAGARPELHFICGSRIKRMGATVERFWYRHYFGRIFATAASLALGLPIYDTQCGAKLIRTELAERLFERPFISRWLFDIELIARMIQDEGRAAVEQALFELPLDRWRDPGSSKVRLSYIPRVPIELFRIRWAYRKALRASSTVSSRS